MSGKPGPLQFTVAALPGIFAAIFIGGASARFVFPTESLLGKVKFIYDMQFLIGFDETERPLRKVVAALTLMLLFFALIRWLPNRRSWNPFFVLATICGAIVLLGPDHYGNGSMIRERLSLFSFILVVAGFAVSESVRSAAPLLAIILSVFSLMGMWNRRSAYQSWNERLDEYAHLGAKIPPGSTVVPLFLGNENVNPTFHAVGYWSPKPFIDLWNYEAQPFLSPQPFTVRFRPGKAVKPAVMPPLDVYLRYLRARNAADFIVVDIPELPAGGMDPWRPAAESSRILDDLELVYASPHDGPLRLYRSATRKPIGVH